MTSIASVGAGLAVALLTGATSVAAPPRFSDRHIDQLVAPIALYPDPLLGKVLMASTYPIQVWQADPCDPWPADAGKPGDFDPSIKSLQPFPQILCLMETNVAWTDQLGEAFLYDRAAVMDAVQKLRRAAKANGALVGDSKVTVTDSEGVITIEPADPATLSAPEYDPSKVFGPWPYPGAPPRTFEAFPGACAVADQGYCWMSWTIVPAVWGWDRLDWPGHRLLIDPARYASLNDGVPPTHGDVWRHDPTHRRGSMYNPPRRRPESAGAP